MAISSDLIGGNSSATRAELLLFYFRDHILPPFSYHFKSGVNAVTHHLTGVWLNFPAQGLMS